MGYFFIFATIFFTVYGQMILKWRLSILQFKIPSGGIVDFVTGFAKIIIDPYILSGFIAAFVASIFWMAAMTKFEITYAYPFMSLSPALVFLLGVLFLGESFTIGKFLGLVIIVVGIIVTVKF
jgi:undecaprenyl phosphate-alpha-L-ara4N flippase subunit ArnF